eukprot:2630871-Amphidinium_carterae.1
MMGCADLARLPIRSLHQSVEARAELRHDGSEGGWPTESRTAICDVPQEVTTVNLINQPTRNYRSDTGTAL